MSPICVHLHENVLASLGVSSRRSPSLLSAAGTPVAGTPPTSRSSLKRRDKMSRDASMVTSSPVEQDPAEDVKHEPDEVGLLVSTLDLAQLLRLSCARAVRQGEIRAQVGFEKTGGFHGCVAYAFEDHLYLAEPTRRTYMTRNNGCLDLGALCKRACKDARNV